jgi:hypothetical protein
VQRCTNVCRAGASPALVQITLHLVGDDQRLRRLTCGKASPVRRACIVINLLVQAGRLSLPDCTEEDEGYGIGGKAGGFPQVGAAEPL